MSSSICCYLFVVHLKIDCIFCPSPKRSLSCGFFFLLFLHLFCFILSFHFAVRCLGAAGFLFVFSPIYTRALAHSAQQSRAEHTFLSRYLMLCNARILYFSSKWIFKLDISLCKKAFRSSGCVARCHRHCRRRRRRR